MFPCKLWGKYLDDVIPLILVNDVVSDLEMDVELSKLRSQASVVQIRCSCWFPALQAPPTSRTSAAKRSFVAAKTQQT